jgi:hypothetical protein
MQPDRARAWIHAEIVEQVGRIDVGRAAQRDDAGKTVSVRMREAGSG